MKQIYLDNAATTKVDEKVIEAMLPYFNERYGNASSQHTKGAEAREALDRSRKIISNSIGAKSSEIFFTSGGTEGNNLVLKGLFLTNKRLEKDHIITTKIEHDCILKTCKWLETLGVRITYLNVDKDGFVNPADVKGAITKKTLLVSVIHGNNEVGTIQDLEAIGRICRVKGVFFHTDACQSYTKTLLNVKKQNLDLVTLNAHKIHGPKGVGALYVREGVKITPLFHGGGHEKGLRSGTENIPGIVGFSKAVEIVKDKELKRIKELRDKLIENLLRIEKVNLNGPKGERRLCNNVNVSFNNIEGESVGGYLEREGVFASTGSACMSNTLESSHVLKAMGLSPLQANSSLRLSLSRYTTEDEVDYFLKVIPNVVQKLRRLSPLVN